MKISVKSISTSHRFNYLFKELSRLGRLGPAKIQKFMIMDCGSFDIVWDMRDGLLITWPN